MMFKESVNLALAPDMAKALPLIELAHTDSKLARGAFITSANDGAHMQGSLHYQGLAVDLRTRDLSQLAIAKLADQLRIRLNGAVENKRPYQVIVEHNHIHIEYDPA